MDVRYEPWVVRAKVRCPYCGQRFEVGVSAEGPDDEFADGCWCEECGKQIALRVSVRVSVGAYALVEDVAQGEKCKPEGPAHLYDG